MPKTKSKANKGISRIDSGSTHGWFVRGYRNGKTYSKLFSDRKCGSKTEALRLAKEYRDHLANELSAISEIPREQRIVDSDQRNTTGELAISHTTKVGSDGSKHECFSVSWQPEPGIQKSTSFSIDKYGENRALQMALDHRRRMMMEIHGSGFYRKLERKK